MIEMLIDKVLEPSRIGLIRYEFGQEHPHTPGSLHGGVVYFHDVPQDSECMRRRVAHEDDKTTEDIFRGLVKVWKDETAGLSSPRAISKHPAYQIMVGMGESILHLIFQDLEHFGGWWYPALRTITGENPVPETARGSPPLHDEAWLSWGREHGYLQPR